ncbi:hypothetical protein B484DRAFT_448619 [Ochromonadaceae sp. CCMP2298]|nr:hypothetical protein B484DRAFT_448619 [Ochromonadaceae sp. CCMP2298]|mmetsp:Transcript_33190/g.73148  ORF Transcript_33190/g.73148 Transcript_33190/m.73148 type:complete len:294 (+) Transcript_33190:72-953(+)
MWKFAALICILISLAAVSRADAFRAPPQSRRRNNAKLSRDAGKGKAVTSVPRVDLRLFDNGRLGAGGGGGRDGNDFSLSASGEDTPAGSGSGVGILAFFKSLFDAYNRILSKHPIATKILSSGIIGGLGDLLVQAININKKGGAIDFRRVAVFTSVCGFYIAPVIDLWFQWLNTLAFPAVLGETGKVLTTLFIDQTLGAVTINAGFFLAFELAQRLIPGKGQKIDNENSILQSGAQQVRAYLWPTLKGSWCWWPFVNYVNFKYIPLQNRLVFSNLAAVFWNMFLSAVVNAPAA